MAASPWTPSIRRRTPIQIFDQLKLELSKEEMIKLGEHFGRQYPDELTIILRKHKLEAL
jgi:hypothetical protein